MRTASSPPTGRPRQAHTPRVVLATLCAALYLVCASPAYPAVLAVEPGVRTLQQVIAAAQPGDTLVLAAGHYAGPVLIDRSLSLTSADPRMPAVIDGGGQGRVITVAAPDVALTHLKVINSGASLFNEDSGIFVTELGDRALLRANSLQDNLIGVYLKGPDDARVLDNRISGRTDLRLSESGNGIHLWNTPGSVIAGNEIIGGRDGIFVTTSRENVFRGNRISGLRFAVHYMYTNDSRVENNISVGNHMGYALMYSSGLQAQNNHSTDDRDKGVMLHSTNESRVIGNLVEGRSEKCLFIYNANFNDIGGNHFSNCDVGVHYTAGSEGNRVFNNSFVNNLQQVMYVGTRFLEWSQDGIGNYWSDHPAFDRSGDGIADNPYRPNNLVDHVIARNAAAKVLLNSPVIQLLRWAQSRFPALYPGGVTDSAPLMNAPGME